MYFTFLNFWTIENGNLESSLINKKYYFLLLFITRVTNTLDYIHKNSREGRKEKKRKRRYFFYFCEFSLEYYKYGKNWVSIESVRGFGLKCLFKRYGVVSERRR